MVYIQIIKRGDDCGEIVQHAPNEEIAKKLIRDVMPKLQVGYYYQIINKA